MAAMDTPYEGEEIPLPSFRHAMPSGPWPWMDIGTKDGPSSPANLSCKHKDCDDCATWLNYPQSLFPNWTAEQVRRSGMLVKSGQQDHCQMYTLDIKENGDFQPLQEIPVVKDREKELWDFFHKERPPLRARAIFAENITSPVLRILGATYTIEPFFFSSSLNWIPSRYQENVKKGMGDHITVTLTFVRTMPSKATRKLRVNSEVIHTQSPLYLESGGDERVLTLDTLAIHMIRANTNSTIISYHPNHKGDANPTKGLHAKVRLIGSSVYWKNIFSATTDITFLFLAILWQGIYAWDEALETLYVHISHLEKKVMDTNDVQLTRELHVIRAHLLNYESLLEDFRKSVEFVLNTRNPVLAQNHETVKERIILEREGNNLLLEIKRLKMTAGNQDMRLRNAINLVFSLVNLADSKHSQELTQASLRDSEATKQLSYLTMLFLPAIFISGVFSMNVKPINPNATPSMKSYVISSVIATIVTAWAMVALQSSHLRGERLSARFVWPYTLSRRLYMNWKKKTR